MMDQNLIDLTLDNVESVVKKYVHERKDEFNGKFRVVSYQSDKLSDEPIGFLGDHYVLSVHVKEKVVTYQNNSEDETDDDSEADEKKITFFMKMFPEFVPKQAEYVEEFGCFKKEIKIFNNLIPRLQDISIGTVPFAATCFFTKGEKIIVFENLQEAGFQIVRNNKGVLDFDHLLVALKTVSKLHAASMVLEERTKQIIPKLYPGHLDENAYVCDENYVRALGLENAIKVLVEIVKRIDKYKDFEKLGEILEKFPDLIRKIYEFAKPSTIYRNVMNHGDLWSNNVMFKYEEANKGDVTDEIPNVKTPIDSRLVDYQLSRYAPPAFDVLTLIMLTTNSDFREENLEKLQDIYYESLTSELAWHHYDVTDFITKKQFDDSWAHYQLAGLIETCLFSHLTLLPPEISTKLMNSMDGFGDFIRKCRVDVCLEAYDVDENYKFRMSDMLSQVVDFYILNK